MFSAPLSLHTDTAYELPAQWRESGADNAWTDAHLPGRDPHSYLQGACFDADGGLWLVDTPFGRVFFISAKGEWELMARYDGWPTALRFHGDGRLVIADARHGLLAMDTASRKIAPFLTHHLTQRFKGVAGMVFSRAGDLYFCDRGQSGAHDPGGAVYCQTAAGQFQCLAANIPGPNGIALSSDEDRLLVAVAGDNAVWHMPLSGGSVSRAVRHIQLSGGNGPQGIAVDQDDNLLAAHDGMGCVWQFNKRGEPKYRIDSSRGDWTTSVAIHPHHPNEIFITESRTGTVLKATLPLY